MKNKEVRILLKESNHRNETYKKYISEAEKSFRELDASNMQGTLIQFEDYLDNNHLYAFRNWVEGVVWDGPNVRRYWVDLTLKYPYEMMPDPRGAVRLVNSGAKITFKEDIEIVPVTPKGPEDIDPMTRKAHEEENEIWLVTIQVPRHYIEDAIEDYEDLEATEEEQEIADESVEEDEEFGDEELGGAEEGGLEELEL